MADDAPLEIKVRILGVEEPETLLVMNVLWFPNAEHFIKQHTRHRATGAHEW